LTGAGGGVCCGSSVGRRGTVMFSSLGTGAGLGENKLEKKPGFLGSLKRGSGVGTLVDLLGNNPFLTGVMKAGISAIPKESSLSVEE
jgi:hypothetical protein